MIADAHVDLLMELAYRERRLGETKVFADTWLPVSYTHLTLPTICSV